MSGYFGHDQYTHKFYYIIIKWHHQVNLSLSFFSPSHLKFSAILLLWLHKVLICALEHAAVLYSFCLQVVFALVCETAEAGSACDQLSTMASTESFISGAYFAAQLWRSAAKLRESRDFARVVLIRVRAAAEMSALFSHLSKYLNSSMLENKLPSILLCLIFSRSAGTPASPPVSRGPRGKRINRPRHFQ